MNPMSDNVALARRYLAALEAQIAPSELTQFFAPDVVLALLPNKVQPQGETRDLAAILATFEVGKKLLATQRYEVLRAFAHGETVALEVLWRGTLAVPAGTRKPGDEMRVHSAMFLEFRGGKIVAQRNYDCFEE